MTTELTVTGMTCGHCEKAVQNALKNVPGVQDVRVNLREGSATVQGDADPQALVAAVTEEGYGAQVRA
ncbi:copper-exporting P-type ATPase [Deinococcus carri]|uniref:Copper-exporting P-type ATPase n=1 Tax=Deinococcus carri TaxID=1211323 RepID=A0ABP9W740_9DEIO